MNLKPIYLDACDLEQRGEHTRAAFEFLALVDLARRHGDFATAIACIEHTKLCCDRIAVEVRRADKPEAAPPNGSAASVTPSTRGGRAEAKSSTPAAACADETRGAA